MRRHRDKTNATLQLIRALYQPNPPETISRVQEVLHRLQRSPEGWQLAQSLIAHREDNIRFYAALTLIIKLNRDRYACPSHESQNTCTSN
jgi:hypothetical protein